MDSKTSGRVAALARHLVQASASDSTSAGRNETSAWHQQCFNFEPGKLLLDQVAIITGGGQGVGKAAAILFAHHGAKVVVSDLDAEKAQSTVDFISNSGGTAINYPGDVSSPDFADGVVDAAVSNFGALHILVNNAGYTWDGMVHKMAPQQWDAMLAVHCTAPFRLIQAATPHMRDAAKHEIKTLGRARPRCILNVSSVSGVHGSTGQANYATAKAGVVGLTKTIAKEWGPFNIRCNCLVFGYIQTRLVQGKEEGHTIQVGGQHVQLGIPQASTTAALMKQMIALGRVGAPEEAAGSMLMLACPYSSYITGQAIEVTGGGWM